jgi:hypothetical protein
MPALAELAKRTKIDKLVWDLSKPNPNSRAKCVIIRFWKEWFEATYDHDVVITHEKVISDVKRENWPFRLFHQTHRRDAKQWEMCYGM